MPLKLLVSATLRSIITSLGKNMCTRTKLALLMRHLPIYPYRSPRVGAFWFLYPPSHVWRLGFDSPRTGYFFNMFLPLGLRNSRTLFLKFGDGLRHTMVLRYIAPIPFRTSLIIFRPVALPLEILIKFCSCSDLELTKNFTRTFSSATNLVSLGIPTPPKGTLHLPHLSPVSFRLF